MVFKRVDRYVSGSFLVHLIGSVCLIAVLYGSFDLLSRLDELGGVAPGRTVAMLGEYYGHVVPLFLADVVPALVLVSAGMVLVRMAKTRELLALQASGTSLRRVVTPLLFWALLISVGVFVLRETLGPNLVRTGELLSHKLDDRIEKELLLSDPRFKAFIGEYDFDQSTMKGVCVLEFYPKGGLKRMTRGDTGGWLADGSLYLEGVEVQEFDASGAQVSTASLPSKKMETDLVPYDLVEAAEHDQGLTAAFRPLADLRRQMQQHPSVPQFRVLFHSRLASLFAPIVLLLLGIPCLVGFEQSVTSRFLGVIVSMVVAVGLYVLTFLFTSMGNTATVSPVVAGWLPTALVGTAGLWMYASMRT